MIRMITRKITTETIECDRCGRSIPSSDRSMLSLDAKLSGWDVRDFRHHGLLEERLDFCSECMNEVWSYLWKT